MCKNCTKKMLLKSLFIKIIEQIAQGTGLTIKEVQKLAEEIRTQEKS